MDKNIIYVNGDSYTEGCELGDHLLVGNRYNLSVNDLIERRKKGTLHKKVNQYYRLMNKLWKPLLPKVSIMEDRHKYQHKHRWTTYLEKELGKPVFNISSQGGASSYAIAYKTICDVDRIIKLGYNVTDVIIQITGIMRYAYFTDKAADIYQYDKRIGHYRYNIESMILTGNKDNDIVTNIAKAETFHHSVLRTLTDYYFLFQSLKKMTNSRIIFVDGIFSRDFLNVPLYDNLSLEENHFLYNFKQEHFDNIKLSMIDTIDDYNDKVITGGYHFTEIVHKRFAKKIAEDYFK